MSQYSEYVSEAFFDESELHSADSAGSENAADREHSVDRLNSFLRGEISAAEAYRIALDKVSGTDEAAHVGVGLLHEIQREHGRAAQALRDRIRELGGDPADSSGAWGVWAKLAMETATLFGDKSTLRGLKEGEEFGLRDFSKNLDGVDSTSLELVRNQLIPNQAHHIDLLRQLIEAPRCA